MEGKFWVRSRGRANGLNYLAKYVGYQQILLQKSKVASVRIFGEIIKREPVNDSDNLSRATEVAYEFCVRR